MSVETASCSGCGRKMFRKTEGSVRRMFCARCGWNAATAYIALAGADMTVYRTCVNGISDSCLDQIRALSGAACPGAAPGL